MNRNRGDVGFRFPGVFDPDVIHRGCEKMVEYEFVRKRNIMNLAHIVDLFKQLWPYKKPQDLQEKKRLLWRKSTRIFLAKEGGEVLGLVTFRPKIFGLIAYVPELVVYEEARGKGIGKNLLKKIVAYAKKRACLGVFLASAIKRRGSHRFYKNNGFINIGPLFFMETGAALDIRYFIGNVIKRSVQGSTLLCY